MRVIDRNISLHRCLQDFMLLAGLLPEIRDAKPVVVLDEEWCKFLQRSLIHMGYADCIMLSKDFQAQPNDINLGAIACDHESYIDVASALLRINIASCDLKYYQSISDQQRTAELLRANDIEPFNYVVMDFRPKGSPELLGVIPQLHQADVTIVALGQHLAALDFGGADVRPLTPPNHSWLADIVSMSELAIFDETSDLGYITTMVNTPGLAVGLSPRGVEEHKKLKLVQFADSHNAGKLSAKLLKSSTKHNLAKMTAMTAITCDGCSLLVVPSRRNKSMAKCHYIAVPSGIGDSLWAMTKVPDYRKKEGVERLTACVQDCDPRRGAEFLSMFDFIDQAAYVKFPIHYPNRSELNLDGSYCYIESQKNFHGMSWLWIPNGHLELGKRLEHWLPEYRTDFEICKNNLEFSDSDVAAANSIRNKVSSKYAVFFLGNRRSNVSDGHNRGNLWSLHDWLQLGDKLHDLGNQIVVVGAKYDVDYSDDLRKHLKKRDFYHIVTGETSIGTTFDLCRKSECVISFQSGIGIVSVYMGVPTVLWWRPYGNSTSPNENIFISFNTTMSHAWAAPYCIGTQYLPQIYSTCTAKSIMADIERAGWFAKDGPHYGKLLSNGIIKSPEDFAKYCQTRSNRHFVDPPKSSY